MTNSQAATAARARTGQVEALRDSADAIATALEALIDTTQRDPRLGQGNARYRIHDSARVLLQQAGGLLETARDMAGHIGGGFEEEWLPRLSSSRTRLLYIVRSIDT